MTAVRCRAKAASGWRRLSWAVGAAMLVTGVANALPPYGPIQITGNLQSQTLIRNPAIDEYQFIQNRNTLRVGLDCDWLKNGKAIGEFSVPWLRNGHLFLLFRGVYDSVYDAAPGGTLHDILGQPVGSIGDLSNNSRKSLRGSTELREAYTDIELRDLPLSFRIGRQQVVWGETDNFRMLDRANPLDLRWHQLYESWDDLRIPLWMIKGLWRIGQVGPLSDAFLEAYWDPGDWVPAQQGFMPGYPWGVPTTNPLNKLVPLAGPLHLRLPITLYHGTSLFNQGDYTRNPGQNSQVGVRVSAVTPQGIQFTLNYFYQRWAGDDGTNYAPIAALTNPADVEEAKRTGQVPAEFIAPYVNTVGFSLNYSEETYTQTVYRLETIYDFGVPFSDRAQKPPRNSFLSNTSLFGVFGATKRDMWKGMIAFDRPTWIRVLNRKSTFFITGQFFWHWLNDHESSFIGNVDPSVPSNDHLREWEAIFTLLVSTFYAAGTIVPTVSYGLDPVNSYNMYIGWTLDYFLTNQFILRVGQNYFIAPGIPPVFESWSLGGFNRGRSESLVRLTYQF